MQMPQHQYAKAIATFCGAISTWGVTAAASGGISAVELFGLLGVLGSTILVAAYPNQSK